jgi:hypothetical protein
LSVQAALMLNKGIFVGNSNTTRKNKHPWIKISFWLVPFLAENLITPQKNENVPVTFTVPNNMRFPQYWVLLPRII